MMIRLGRQWANTYLSRKRLQIDDLYADLSDGLRLIALLQIICREKVVRVRVCWSRTVS